MGQYHKLFNLDKKQMIKGHDLDTGLKLMEQVGFEVCAASALWLLVAASNGRGGGDATPHPLIGSWAGDRVAVIGDYAEPNDVPGFNAPEVYNSDEYENISRDVLGMLKAEFSR